MNGGRLYTIRLVSTHLVRGTSRRHAERRALESAARSGFFAELAPDETAASADTSKTDEKQGERP